jgi:hypothetical protein
VISFLGLDAQIWVDQDTGIIYYYVVQSLGDDSDEHLARGEATDWADAEKQVLQAITEVLS